MTRSEDLGFFELVKMWNIVFFSLFCLEESLFFCFLVARQKKALDSVLPRAFKKILSRCYRSDLTQEACGPLSPMVSPKLTLSPSDSSSMCKFFSAFSWK